MAEMALTTSRWQLLRREAWWGGSRRRIHDPTDRNRIGGGAVWASLQRLAKPVVIKRPSRKCGGCVEKVAWLIPGGLHGCRGMPVQPLVGLFVGWDATVMAGRSLGAVEKSAEVVVPAGVVVVAGKGPNVKPSVWSCPVFDDT